jgi:hypothetical protein
VLADVSDPAVEPAIENGSTYSMHGVGLTIHADRPEVVDAIASRLAPFASKDAGPPDLAFRIVEDDLSTALADLAGARPVYDTDLGAVGYLDEGDRLLIDCPGLAQLDAAVGEGTVTIRYAPGEDALDLATHPLFTLALMEGLKRRGRYSLHASCVARGDRGVLCAAPSGSGKTTMAVAMTRAGWSFLSDDMVFLQPTGEDAIEVLGFPDEVDLTEDATHRFPELAHLQGRSTRGTRNKHQIRIETVFDGAPQLECRPSLMLFPTIDEGHRSTMEELRPGEALQELLPNVLLTDEVSSQRHLDVLGALVARTPCYRFRLGRDLDDAVELIATSPVGP